MTTDPQSPRIRLETWGEIAARLGVDIRTAQRWKEKLGLPVHRQAGGQRIYAYADEIDAWQSAREHPLTAPAVTPTTDREAATPSSAARWWPAVAMTVSLLIVVAVVMIVRSPRIQGSEPVIRVTVADGKLIGVGASGARVWTSDAPGTLGPPDVSYRTEIRNGFEPFDLDGDGHDEWIGIVTQGVGADADESLLCLSSGGHLLWSYRPDLSLQFRAGTFGAPWRIFDVEPVIDGADRSLWLAVNHSVWWPGAVVRLASDGRPELRYVQPGSVRVVKSAVQNSRRVVLGAGVINGTGSASIVVLDPKAPASSAPADGPHDSFQCLNCPTGSPVSLVLLPRTPVNAVAGLSYSQVGSISHSGEWRVTTFEAQAFEGASVIFGLDGQWRVSSMTPTDGYWAWQPPVGRTLSLADRMLHEATVRQWSNGQWQKYQVQVVAPPAGR